MPIKMYVLLPHMDTNAPIYQTVLDGQRMQIKKIPRWRPYLQMTYQDKDGKNRTIRYKGNSDTIFQDEQIKNGILANEQFSTVERNDLWFTNGLLATAKLSAQRYLDAYPGCEGFDGLCDDIREPIFKVLDKGQDVKTSNADLRKRAKCLNKILELDLEGAKDMLIRINGSFFETPDDVEECQNMLVNFLDDTEDAGLNAILKEEEDLNIDEQNTVLIGHLLNSNLLSFDRDEGKISKKTKDGKWIVVRDMSNEYTMDEKKRLFSDFLNTDDGKPLKNDLETDLKSIGKTSNKNSKKLVTV